MRVVNTAKASRIDAKLLIPGRGEPLHNASLIYAGKEILSVGLTEDLPSQYANLHPSKVDVLMPGLWDCHVHFFGMERYNSNTIATTNMAVSGIRSARDIIATLNAGYTSVRELAGYGPELNQVIKEGWLPGPNIYSAVSILSTTGGHGDAREIPIPELWTRIYQGIPFYVCDGPLECIKAVRAQIRRGAKVIKVSASGGITSAGDDIMAQQFSEEELRAIVEEANRNNVVVAAHCIGKPGIMAALRAGCRTIEHGIFLDNEAIDLMLEKDAILVATRGTLEWAVQNPDAWNPDQYEQLLSIRSQHRKAYTMAVKARVRIALGTDLGPSTLSTPWNHGMNGVELQYAVEAGMSPLQAIEAATTTAPETLGTKAPKSGLLKEGYDADFISLEKNPLDDIEILSKPSNVIDVWQAGKHIKVGGRPVSILE